MPPQSARRRYTFSHDHRIAHSPLQQEPEADRAFFRDVLKFHTVELGGGWLIFRLPPAEMGIHPIDEGEHREQGHGGLHLLGALLYLMCDDLKATIALLKAKKHFLL